MTICRSVAAFAAAAVLAGGAHLRAPAVHAQMPATGRVLTITAKNYAFDVPDSVAAGRTEIRLVNQGPELHHAFLIKLEDGKTPADFAQAMQAGGAFPSWARDVGGPNTPAPGKTSIAVLDLKPGTYLLTCVIPSPDGKPHMMKGMARTLTVTAPAIAQPARAVAEEASTVGAADVTMKLVDYGFDLSKPLAAGKHVIRVQNVAEQSHEVVLARLAPGKTPQDLLNWIFKPEGPPPGEPMGGTAAMAKGEWNDIVVDLSPGEYAMFCFVPDAKDGKEHVAHGMIRQFSVK